MSFAMTTEQIRERTKFVTRRFGWDFLVPCQTICAVEKGMGLKKGEKVVKLGLLCVVSTRWEPLNAITREDVALEGFPGKSPEWFVQKLVKHYRVKPDALVNRIEFGYVMDDGSMLLHPKGGLD
jgi:hypothetical protein